MAKKNKRSTQSYLEIGEIRDGIIILDDGSLRLVLKATSINFALKSEQEQNALIGQFQNFLNSLNFPIQIVVQSRKLDLTEYLKSLEERIDKVKNDLLKIQIADYVQFVRQLINMANIMNKKFFIVISLNPPNIKRRGLFDKLFNPANKLQVKISENEFKSFKEEISQLTGVVNSGLSSMGIKSEPMETQEIIELFYGIYNPEESAKEKLVAVEKMGSPLIGKKEDK